MIIKILLLMLGVALINFLTIMILIGSYSMIDGLIQDITGISISERIQNYFTDKGRK